MPKKGQVLVFENVLIFTIGVAIFIMCYAVFTVYQAQFSAQGTADQLWQIQEYLSSNIVMLAGKPANSTLVLQVPKTLGGEPYEIVLTASGLNITSRTSYSFYPLNNLPIELENRTLSSTRGRVILKKADNQISIRYV